MDILRITDNEVILSEAVIDCATDDEITDLKDICDEITERYKRKMSLKIIDELKDFSPEKREEFRERINEEIPEASEYADAVLAVIESMETEK